LSATGIEWLVEARGCEPAKVADRASLGDLFDEIVHDLSLNVIGRPVWHSFPGPGGVTGVCVLAESHLAVHTFPEHGSLCLNLFCCRPRPDWDFVGRLTTRFGAAEVNVRRIEREYTALPAAIST
jgi:S-adenosylmethionine decarboxylase